jgi:hypothetical protein
MFEMSIQTISKELLKEIIDKAKARRDFKERSNEMTCFTIRKDVLPDLQGYVLASETSIAGVTGIADCPLDLFRRLAEPLRDRVLGCGVDYNIAHSNTGYNPEEEMDLLMVFRHGQYGWGVGLAVGTLSAGDKDLFFRADLFRNLVKCAGLSESVNILLEAGELSLKSETVKYAENLASLTSQKASDVGHCIYWANGGKIRWNNDRSMTTSNFSTLEFYFPAYCDFLTAAKRCMEHFVSLGAVTRTIFWLVDYDGDYEELRSFLSINFPCDDWRVKLLGRPKYGIEDLDKMFEETDSLLLPLFVIKDRKVGEINVELYHSKGVPTLHFSTYTEDIDKADKVIRQIVTELSDGKAVINEEV